EIERAAVHGGTDVAHVAIRRDDDGRYFLFALLQLLQQRQPVHARHVEVGDNEIDVAVCFQRRQGVDTVVGEQKRDGVIPDLMTELLENESLQVRLVINDQDAGGHAARSTCVSISLRSIAKSIGLVKRPSAPPSNALRFVSASP